MMFRSQVAWSWAALLVALIASPCLGQLATFQQGVAGYAGTHDTMFNTQSISTPLGNIQFVTVDDNDDGHRSQGALRFNNIFQSQGGLVPDSGVLIGFASIRFWVDSASDASAAITFNRVLPASPWSEATSTWLNLGGDSTPDPNGIFEGALPIKADNVESVAVANAIVPDPEAENEFIEIDVRTDFLAWYNDPTKTNNLGWAITNSTDNGWDFLTSEYVDPLNSSDFSKRPKLTVAWVIEPGDFDLDTEVGLEDYDLLLENMAIQLDGPIEPGHTGDLDFDRDVDLDDFALFKGFFEDFQGMSLADALAGVPEPSTAVLLIVVAGCNACGRRRRAVSSCPIN